MKLYTFPQSHNSLRVTSIAYSVGIDLELIVVDLAKAEQMEPEFIKLNPNHKVPTLVDDDFVLWESTAIMFYLAEKYPEAGLVPVDLQKRMLMHQWVAWDTMEFTPAEHVFIHENRVKKKLNLGEPDQERLRIGAKNFHRFASVLDGHLKGNTWILGDSCSLADYHIVAPLIHADSCDYPLHPYKEIQRWSNLVFNTKPWQRAMADLAKY